MKLEVLPHLHLVKYKTAIFMYKVFYYFTAPYEKQFMQKNEQIVQCVI